MKVYGTTIEHEEDGIIKGIVVTQNAYLSRCGEYYQAPACWIDADENKYEYMVRWDCVNEDMGTVEWDNVDIELIAKIPKEEEKTVVKVKGVEIKLEDILEETKNMSKHSRNFLLSLVRKEAQRDDRDAILMFLENPDYSCSLEAFVTRILRQVLTGSIEVIGDIREQLLDNLDEEEGPILMFKGIADLLTEISEEINNATPR